MALLWTFSTYAVLIITLHGPSGSALPLDERDHTEESLLHYADDPVLEASDEAEGSIDGVPADRDDSTNYLGTDDVTSRSTETSINLCCRRGYQWTWDGCVELEEPAHIPSLAIFDSLLLNQSHLNVNIVSEYQNGSFRIIEQHPCHESYQQIPYDEEEFKVLDNGSIYTIYGRIIDSDSYCISSNATGHIAVQCYTSEWGIDPFVKLLSGLCLVVTFVVYSVVPELRTIHVKILQMYVLVCASQHFVDLLEDILLTNVTVYLHSNFCNAGALIGHFLMMAILAWLNVMSFDIWRNFRRIRAPQIDAKTQERKKFIIYSICAWGYSATMSGVYILAIIISSVVDDDDDYVEAGCAEGFYDENLSQIFIDLPFNFTMIVTVLLFSATAWKIRQYKKSIRSELERTESQRHDVNKQRCQIYVKLFVVMGMCRFINWSCYQMPYFLPEAIYTFINWISMLQGVWIFIICISTNNVKPCLIGHVPCLTHLSRQQT